MSMTLYLSKNTAIPYSVIFCESLILWIDRVFTLADSNFCPFKKGIFQWI